MRSWARATDRKTYVSILCPDHRVHAAGPCLVESDPGNVVDEVDPIRRLPELDDDTLGDKGLERSQSRYVTIPEILQRREQTLDVLLVTGE